MRSDSLEYAARRLTDPHRTRENDLCLQRFGKKLAELRDILIGAEDDQVVGFMLSDELLDLPREIPEEVPHLLELATLKACLGIAACLDVVVGRIWVAAHLELIQQCAQVDAENPHALPV